MFGSSLEEGAYVMNERLTQRTSSRDMGQDRVVRYSVWKLVFFMTEGSVEVYSVYM